MKSAPEGGFLALAPDCFLKRLETPALYDRRRDELYELDEEAYLFLASSPSAREAESAPGGAELVRFCLEEGIARFGPARRPLPVPPRPSAPTLRYLLVHITGECNLRCRHCFLGKPSRARIEAGDLFRLAEEFSAMQGLRFIVSGGEPLGHPGFREINEGLARFPFRRVLLTNGTLIDGRAARDLRFHEVQVSLDGMERAHDLLRGKGSFRKALEALDHLAATEVDLSVATMVHAANLGDFEGMRDLLSGYRLRSWSVDVPCLTGSYSSPGTLAAPDGEAAQMLRYAFGGGYYGSSGPWSCGPHLAAVMADGRVCKCGHYAHRPAGSIGEGLATAWGRMERHRLDELQCRCSHLRECRGGCRYRAELSSCIEGPDPIQCFSRGVPLGGDLVEERGDGPSRPKGGERG